MRTRTGVLVEFSRRGRCPVGEERVPDAGKDMLSWEQPGDKGVCGAGGGQSHDAGREAGSSANLSRCHLSFTSKLT